MITKEELTEDILARVAGGDSPQAQCAKGDWVSMTKWLDELITLDSQYGYYITAELPGKRYRIAVFYYDFGQGRISYCHFQTVESWFIGGVGSAPEWEKQAMEYLILHGENAGLQFRTLRRIRLAV